MRVPSAAAAIPLLAGSAAGLVFVDSIPQHLVLASAACALFALLAGWGFATEDLGGAVLATVAGGCFAAGLSMGASTAKALYSPSLLQWFDRQREVDGDPAVIRGTLREDGAQTEQGASLTIDVRSVDRLDGVATQADGGIRVFVTGTVTASHLSAWRAGRLVRVPVLLRRPAPFRDPGVPDETRPLARRGIVLTGTIKSASLVEVLENGSTLEEIAAAIRARVRGVLSSQLGPYSARSAGIAIAILIGDRTGLSDEDQRRLRDAGTYHVIAISGGNIAIFTALLLVVARLARLPYRAAALLAIAVLLLYGEVAGGSASVSRAVTAAVIFLSALVVDHRGSPLNTVAMAALLGAAAFPAAVLDPGFLLSFGATAGIMLGVPRLARPLPQLERARPGLIARVVAEGARTLLAATLCAEIVLAPVTAVIFARVSAAGLILNFAAIPLMTVVQIGSMAIVGLGAGTSGWARPAALVVHRAATALVESARFVDLFPWLARDVVAPSWWLCGTYYLAAAALLCRRWTRVPAASVLAICAALIAGGPPATSRGLVPAPPAGTLRVVVLDVGQGDATVLALPDGTAVLVDAGGLAGSSFDIAGRVVVPALRALRVRELHALVITHADPDHVGGAGGLLARFRPRNIWEGVPVPPLPALTTLAARANLQRTVWRTLRPGDVDRAAGVEIRVLHPPPPDWERQRVRNDDSVVLDVRYGDVSVVLPGDIGEIVERTLAPALDLRPLVVLKAAHHGSATSSSEVFLDAVRPSAVIFSAGRNNRFGHPAPVVVQRYAKRGVEMFNTAEDGAVFVETDGKKVEVRGWTGRAVSIVR